MSDWLDCVLYLTLVTCCILLYAYRDIKPYRDPVVLDRATSEPIPEIVPNSVRWQLSIFFDSWCGIALAQSPPFRWLMKVVSDAARLRYDSPRSIKHVQWFIKAYNVNVEEAERPVSEYLTLNDFFARKLKPDARPIYRENDAISIVQPCDCRLHVFPAWGLARDVVVKGRHFTLRGLLPGPVSSDWVSQFEDCGLVICRLAPTDYHRFHCPVDCTLVGIHGPYGKELFTVKPIALRTEIDVLTVNKRLVVHLRSKECGDVLYVVVGATQVGSIYMTAEVGQELKKGDELGCFKYGGSTVLLLFERGRIAFDDDLVRHSKTGRETYVKMGQSLGRAIME